MQVGEGEMEQQWYLADPGGPAGSMPAGVEADFGARLLAGAAFKASVTLPDIFSIDCLYEWNTSLH